MYVENASGTGAYTSDLGSGYLPPSAVQTGGSWKLTLTLAIAACVVALSALGFVVQRNNLLPVGVPILGKDSGIAACEAMASKASKPVVNESKAPGTAEQFAQLRGVFADSRYPEIRENGTKFVDVVRQVTALGEDSGMAGLVFIGPLTESYSGLASACADHGYTIPALGDK